jgi:hypothetical protein
VVLAATNRPDLIESAVLRPGRFDRRINLEIPDLTGRIGILKVHARNKVLASNVDLEVVARRTTGMSGADLENLLNEAAIRGTKRAALAITMDDIDGAYFDVLLGRVRNGAILVDDDRRTIAVHEAGHAIAAATVEGAKRPQKATIVPRGRALGVVLSTPIEDRKLVCCQSPRTRARLRVRRRKSGPRPSSTMPGPRRWRRWTATRTPMRRWSWRCWSARPSRVRRSRQSCTRMRIPGRRCGRSASPNSYQIKAGAM